MQRRRSRTPALPVALSPLVDCRAVVWFLCRDGPDRATAEAKRISGESDLPLQLGRFVKWPEAAPAGKGDSFSICVLGQDPFGPVLDSTLAGEALDGKPVVPRRLSKPPDAGECRILFISTTEEKHLKEILTAVDDGGVLTVSDMPGFTRRGGIIQFVLEGDRVRFEINLASAENARLVMSSELLKVATNVKRNGRSGD